MIFVMLFLMIWYVNAIFLRTFHDIFSGNWAPVSTTRGWKSRLDFQQNPPVEIGAQFEPHTGKIEPPTFCLQTKIQTGRLDFGFWSLDFGVWILDFGFWILDFGFWIFDFGFWILDLGFWIVVVSVLFVAAPNAAVWILDFGFRILDLGFWILGQGLDFA